MKLFNGLEFINDEKVIGKWEYFDVINSKDEFYVNKIKNPKSEKGFKEIYFMPNGQGYWIFEGWTKGILIVHHGGDDPLLYFKYTIEEKENEQYMFLEVVDEEDKYICVLKKVSDKKFKISDFARQENINVPFVIDDKIIGVWKSVGFVKNISDFNPDKNYSEYLWLKEIEFNPNGYAARKYFDVAEVNFSDKWSKGVLLDPKKLVVSHYSFKTINGILYMFMEWKMGNYVYGGEDPSYYVFIKDS